MFYVATHLLNHALGLVSLAAAEALIRGRERKSPLLNSLTFGAYNRPFRPNRTEFDWLSRDPAEVDRYVGDPYCGGVFTAGFFADLFDGLHWTFQPTVMARIPRQLPIYLISGAEDPVGGQGAGVTALANRYRALGIRDAEILRLLRSAQLDKAFHELVRVYRIKLFHLCLSFFRDQMEAEDALQKSLIRIWLNMQRYD